MSAKYSRRIWLLNTSTKFAKRPVILGSRLPYRTPNLITISQRPTRQHRQTRTSATIRRTVRKRIPKQGRPRRVRPKGAGRPVSQRGTGLNYSGERLPLLQFLSQRKRHARFSLK